MARSSHTKSSISIDLFNLPPLPDTRRQSTMQHKIPNMTFSYQMARIHNSARLSTLGLLTG